MKEKEDLEEENKDRKVKNKSDTQKTIKKTLKKEKMSLTDLFGKENEILHNKYDFTNKKITELDDEVDED